MPTRVLVLTDDRLGVTLAGPAIRAVELARALAAGAHVTLASVQPLGDVEVPGVAVEHADEARLRALVATHDVVLAGGLFYAGRPWLLASDKPLVLDLYAPFLLEDVARLGPEGELGRLTHAQHRAGLDAQLRRADFMICASERQRDYWLGKLCSLGRVTPASHATDPTLEGLIAVVPFGLPVAPPAPGPRRLREGAETLFVWGGGLWDWLDPLTPIAAMDRLPLDGPPARLVLWAGKSPNPTTPAMAVAARARAIAGPRVSFVDAWVPYAERGQVLLEADAGVTAHLASLESRFAFRTRALDYLWAGRPILCTRGDVMADLVEREGLGLVLAPGDVEGWAAAFERVRTDPAWVLGCRARVEAVRPRFAWSEVVKPLAAFVAAPHRAAVSGTQPGWALAGPGARVAKAWSVLKHEGPRGLARRLARVRARR